MGALRERIRKLEAQRKQTPPRPSPPRSSIVGELGINLFSGALASALRGGDTVEENPANRRPRCCVHCGAELMTIRRLLFHLDNYPAATHPSELLDLIAAQLDGYCCAQHRLAASSSSPSPYEKWLKFIE